MSSEPAEKRLKVPMKLGYWKIRGLAQPIRLLLSFTNTEFEDVLYEQGDAPDFSREEWLSVKFSLGLDFPNLPYLIDGDLKLTQSNAILNHIARKNNLCGKTDSEKATVDMLGSELLDFRLGFNRICYGKDDPMYIATAKEKIKRFSDYLGSKTWLVGSEITSADFLLYEYVDILQVYEPTILDGFPNIKAFLGRFEELPAIQDYMKSGRFIRRPINNKIARWPGN